MNTRLLIYVCAVALSAAAFAQTPTISPTVSPSPAVPSPAPSATATASAAASVAPSSTGDDDDIAASVRRKLGRHHFGVTVNGKRDLNLDNMDPTDAGGIAVAIIGVIFTTLFGAPVLIVAAVMFFSYLKSRSLHRTVRMMVEKGQPVPPELFQSPRPGTPAKQRSDFRRGIILMTVGVGLMIFFGTVSDFDRSGPWVIGLLPFLIGVAYLALGKFDSSRKDNGATIQ